MKNYLNRIKKSLALKLSFGILLLAIPMFAISLGILFLQSRYNIKNAAKEHAASVLSTTLQHLHRYLGTVETATESNAWLVMEHLHPDTLMAFSARIVILNANVSGCSITTEPYTFPQYGRYFSAYTVRQGDSICTVREAEYEYFEKPWYAIPKKRGEACWIDPFDDYNAGTLSADGMIASYCKPLYDEHERFLGVISTDLSLAQLSSVINSEQKPFPHSYFMLLGEDGHYFVHPDTTKLVHQTIFDRGHEQQTSEIIALGYEMTTGQKGVAEVRVDGVSSLVCYEPVAGTRWSLALVCPVTDVLKSYYTLSYVITLLMVIGLLLIWLFCRRIVDMSIRPLRRLLDQSQLIESGQHSELILHTYREDVIGRLQNSFATMQESIEHHIKRIEKINAETERRNQELMTASLMAKEADRQKTLFIQNMMHQIRTPLNIIMGGAQIIRDSAREQYMTPEELRGVAAMMRQNALHLNRMVLMLYDSSDSGWAEELNTQKQEVVSCNEAVRESIEFTRQHFPGVRINFTSSVADSFCIHTNWLYFMRSIRELLYNSAKYSDGSNISISVTETPDTVRIVEQDTGPGIAAALREQMFTPFVKSNDLSEGLGLGLPLTKRHITFLGGTIKLDTYYKRGCRFIIEFPKVS